MAGDNSCKKKIAVDIKQFYSPFLKRPSRRVFQYSQKNSWLENEICSQPFTHLLVET